jgi:hypothetical protein
VPDPDTLDRRVDEARRVTKEVTGQDEISERTAES